MIPLVPLLAFVTVTGGLADSQVLQRGADGQATPVATGTAEAAGRLEVRVGAAAWSELGKVAPGPWEVRLPALSTGGPHEVRLRWRDATGQPRGEKLWREVFVGDLWVLAGQSNMVGRARVESTAPVDARLRMLSLAGTWQPATHPLHEEPLPPGVTRPGHGPGLEFARVLAGAGGVPVGLLPCAKGGTSMAQWSPDRGGSGRDALYANLLAQVRRAGGRVAGILWYQGENDTGAEPAAVYAARFREFAARLRADLGRPDLPFLYAQLGRYAGDPQKFYAQWDVVREAQRQAEADLLAARLVATVDLALGDLIHLNRESQDRLGRRFAHAAQGRAGPRLADARWTSPNELRVRLSGTNGRLQAPGGRVLGFEALDPDGRRKPLFFHAAIDVGSGEIVLSANRDSGRREAPEAIDLWYGRGHDAVANVTDELDLALPAFGPVRLPPRPPAPPRKG